MKNCCEEKKETNPCFNPCYEDKGHIIRKFIDNCSGVPVYPVTNLKAVITEDSTLNGCEGETLEDVLNCIIDRLGGESNTDDYVISCERTTNPSNSHYLLRFTRKSGETFDCDLENLYGTNISYNNGELHYVTPTGRITNVNLRQIIEDLIPDYSDIFVEDIVFNRDNNKLIFKYNTASGKPDLEVDLSDAFADTKVQSGKYNEEDKKLRLYYGNNCSGGVVEIDLSDIDTNISQSLFIPGYYYSKNILKKGKDKISLDPENFKYIGTDLTVSPTIEWNFIYNAITETEYEHVASYKLPSKNYVYFVSTGNVKNIQGDVKPSEADPTTNVPDNNGIYRPIGEIAYFKSDKGKPCLQILNDNESFKGLACKFDGNEITPLITNPGESFTERTFTNPYIVSSELEVDGEFEYTPERYIHNPKVHIPLYKDDYQNTRLNNNDRSFIKMLNEEKEVEVPIISHDDANAFPIGDINGDGVVDGTDLNILINIIMNKDSADNYDGRADLNGDGLVNGTDLNTFINIILGK